MLGYCKMAVISGDGAEELAPFNLLPWLRSADSVGHAVADYLIHHSKAAVPADKRMRRVRAHHMREQALCLRDSVKSAVVAAILPALGVEDAAAVDNIEHTERQIQLLRRRLSARQIERHAVF